MPLSCVIGIGAGCLQTDEKETPQKYDNGDDQLG